MKPQIIYIHGGDSFDSDEEFYTFLRDLTFDPYKQELQTWRKWLEEQVAESHEFIYMTMPNKFNADYEAWAIWFEKLMPFLSDEVTLIGYSLGGGFLLRYLTENKLPVVVKQLHLVAPVVDDKDCPGVGGFKINLNTWPGFATECISVHLWHSSDDLLVPLHHSERFVVKHPTAHLHIFTDRGHFFQPEFSELLAEIVKP
jgi:pimeloyl-ACP methyl ester carboxylesterase